MLSKKRSRNHHPGCSICTKRTSSSRRRISINRKRCLPRYHRPDLHRASGAPFPELLRMERPQECRQRPQTSLLPCLAGDVYITEKEATDDVEAEKALADFETEWGQKYPSIVPSWRRAWQEVIPFFAFPPEVRKIIYTTNAIESLNRVIRKTTKTRGSFPTDEAATKLIYLAIRSFEKAGRCVREWVAARNQFAILYPERFNK